MRKLVEGFMPTGLPGIGLDSFVGTPSPISTKVITPRLRPTVPSVDKVIGIGSGGLAIPETPRVLTLKKGPQSSRPVAVPTTEGVTITDTPVPQRPETFPTIWTVPAPEDPQHANWSLLDLLPVGKRLRTREQEGEGEIGAVSGNTPTTETVYINSPVPVEETGVLGPPNIPEPASTEVDLPTRPEMFTPRDQAPSNAPAIAPAPRPPIEIGADGVWTINADVLFPD